MYGPCKSRSCVKDTLGRNPILYYSRWHVRYLVDSALSTAGYLYYRTVFMVWLLPLEFFRWLDVGEAAGCREGQRVRRRCSEQEEGHGVFFLVICAASAPPMAHRNGLVCATACSGRCFGGDICSSSAEQHFLLNLRDGKNR